MRQYFGPVLQLPEGVRIVVKPLNLLMLGSQLPLKRRTRDVWARGGHRSVRWRSYRTRPGSAG